MRYPVRTEPPLAGVLQDTLALPFPKGALVTPPGAPGHGRGHEGIGGTRRNAGADRVRRGRRALIRDRS